MVQKRKRIGKKPYYGKKGGAAEYKDELNFDINSTMRALRDYYKGRTRE